MIKSGEIISYYNGNVEKALIVSRKFKEILTPRKDGWLLTYNLVETYMSEPENYDTINDIKNYINTGVYWFYFNEIYYPFITEVIFNNEVIQRRRFPIERDFDTLLDKVIQINNPDGLSYLNIETVLMRVCEISGDYRTIYVEPSY